jgi:hypothetical protein
MKPLQYIIFLSILIFTSSCSNEFDLIEDKKEIPVVYCLLDYKADNQYVRLERAFASPTTSALIIAKDPDSLYYKNADVRLVRTHKGLQKEFILKEVDGNQDGYPRKDGVFATSPNKLYKISSTEMKLEPGDIVDLKINIGEGDLVTSKTSVIMEVAPSNPNPNGKVVFSNTQKDVLKWNSFEGIGGKLHSLDLYFNYTEVVNGIEFRKSLYWPIAKNVEKETFILGPGEFYTFLATNIVKDEKIKRYFEGIDFSISSGDENLAQFLLIAAANTGITGSGEIPTYSNLNRGLGIFGSKAIFSAYGLDLANPTRALLKESELTKGLNFQ